MSTDLIKYEKLPVTSMNELAQAGNLIAQSGMFGINNPAAGFVVMCTCQQQGITIMDFGRTYHIIDGKPTMKADAMLAEYRKRGGKCRIIENSTTKAEAEFEFDGSKMTFAFSMDDAKRTGDCYKSDGKTLKHTWEHRADDMLWARMVSRAVRRLCPEIVSGLYTPEEVQDFEPEQHHDNIPTAPVDPVARAKAVQAVTEAFSSPDIVPEGFGPYSGKRWGDLDSDLLDNALKSPKLSDDHKNAVKAILAKRGDA